MKSFITALGLLTTSLSVHAANPKSKPLITCETPTSLFERSKGTIDINGFVDQNSRKVAFATVYGQAPLRITSHQVKKEKGYFILEVQSTDNLLVRMSIGPWRKTFSSVIFSKSSNGITNEEKMLCTFNDTKKALEIFPDFDLNVTSRAFTPKPEVFAFDPSTAGYKAVDKFGPSNELQFWVNGVLKQTEDAGDFGRIEDIANKNNRILMKAASEGKMVLLYLTGEQSGELVITDSPVGTPPEQVVKDTMLINR